MSLYQIFTFTIYGKYKKGHKKIINLKNQLRHGLKIFSYLMSHIVYQIFKIILSILLKKYKTFTDTMN